MSPRRRSTDPTTAISITMTRSLLDKIDDKLTRTQSRSAWIADACEAKLGTIPSSDIDSLRLMAMVVERLPDGTLKNLLFEHVTNMGSV